MSNHLLDNHCRFATEDLDQSEVLDAFRKQYRLCSALTLDKALHSA